LYVFAKTPSFLHRHVVVVSRRLLYTISTGRRRSQSLRRRSPVRRGEGAVFCMWGSAFALFFSALLATFRAVLSAVVLLLERLPVASA